jgi:hypothetical protein
MISSRRVTSCCSGRFSTRTRTHSMTRLLSGSGHRGSRSCGLGILSSTRKLFSPRFSVNSVGTFFPVSVQYSVAPKLYTSVFPVTASHFTCSGAM